MGQKVNPHGLRVGVIKDWDSKWYAEKDFADNLVEDHEIRKFLKKRLYSAGISKIEIERASDRVKIIVYTAKPGVVIGKGGSEIEKVKAELAQFTDKKLIVDIKEVKRPDKDAQLVAENIAQQLENRISFRRAMKSTMQRTMKSGAKGIKTSVSGRLGGADMARTEFYSDGTIPLQTLRADIDYGFAEADTTYGKVEMCIRDRETDVSNSRIDCFRKGNLYCISIIDQVLVKEILDSAKLEFSGVSGGMPLVSNSIVYQRDCCKRAFVRGAFLSAGSISDPQKGYHFEIVCPSREISGQLQEIIHSFHIDAKIVLRKKSYVLYVKEGAQIVDMLAIMEANVALMDLENIRILKEMRNSVNRKVNCETANINKTVNAAVKQIEDIRLLEEKVGLESLNEGLEEIARLRLQYPEATLKELGLMLNPQVGKSGVNHRLRKLSLLADDLRENKEELL